ncbi:glycosyltransferase family 2 protein [Plantibacter flavus]|nr:glycosyltransferase family 2 protein [Plantibacter flavus]MDD9153903.1 glycosyltransferase family 2 protein [Plantibacter flavus]
MHTVSVIMAARNEESSIERSVRQTLELLTDSDELIVVDDASDDATPTILASISDGRLRVFNNGQRLGRAASRNLAISHSQSDYLAIQDADDYPLTGRLGPLREMLDEDSSLVAVSGQCIALDPKWGAWRHTEYPVDPSEIAQRLDSGEMAVCHTGSMLRRSAVHKVGLYDPSFVRAQDLDLLRRLSSAGKLRNTDATVVLYSHPVLLPWKYWYVSRVNHDAVVGRPTPRMLRLRLRYSLANVRRAVRFILTHRRAEQEMKDLSNGHRTY